MGGGQLRTTFCHSEADTCDDDIPIPDYKLPIETRLVRCLRLWRDDPQVLIQDDRAVIQEIHELLEWYIWECIPYGPDNVGGWWSDGVIHLVIDEPTTDRFKLLGVTWIDCYGIAPFEIDVELEPENETYITRTIFRIEMLDDHRRPLICHQNLLPSRVFENRPRYIRDWAMAVELTPTPYNVTDQSDEREPE